MGKENEVLNDLDQSSVNYIYRVGNVVNIGLCKQKQNKFFKTLRPVGFEPKISWSSLWHFPDWPSCQSGPEPPAILVETSASTWIEKARLPCWPLYSQQVLHQRWIWGAHKRESMQGIHPGFEPQGRCHQKSKTGVSVVSQKGLMSSKNF